MITLKNVNKFYHSGNEKIHAVRDFSVTFPDKGLVFILGPSGSGKSTLLRCMNLLEEPTYGEVWVEEDLLTPIDPYLHFDVIRLSNTYKSLIAQGMSDEDAIKEIKEKDLLKKKEGKE